MVPEGFENSICGPWSNKFVHHCATCVHTVWETTTEFCMVIAVGVRRMLQDQPPMLMCDLFVVANRLVPFQFNVCSWGQFKPVISIYHHKIWEVPVMGWISRVPWDTARRELLTTCIQVLELMDFVMLLFRILLNQRYVMIKYFSV